VEVDELEKRQWYKRLISVTLAAAVLALAGCSGGGQTKPAESGQPQQGQKPQGTAGPKKGGSLKFGLYGDVAEMDPHLTGDVTAWIVLENIYERLTMLGDDMTPKPALAEKWDVSPDGLTYTFTIRKGVKFHNGREMTAKDVVYSVNRIMDPKVPARAKPYFEFLDKVEAPDANTVKMVFKTPFVPILYALARLEVAIVPQEEVEKQGGKLSTPVGTGPFQFVERRKDQMIKLKRNDSYWQAGKPLLDDVTYVVLTDPDTRVSNLVTGEIHAIYEVPPKDVATLKSAKGVVVQQETGTFWPHLAMNTSKKPFDNPKVRQAIRLALDREEILQLVGFGFGKVSDTIVPSSSPFYTPIPTTQPNVDQAKKLLSEAGYANGFEVSLRAVKGRDTNLAQVIQSQLSQVGIKVKVIPDEQVAWFAEVFNQHKYELAITAHVSKIDPDLSFYDIQITGGPKNYTEFSDKEMDDLLRKGRAEPDLTKRKEQYAQVQKIFAERNGYIPLYLQDLLLGYRDTVKGLKILHSGDIRLWDVWLDQ
jgi:ABC-type transport system substrate-binding protein